ncbi:hypothetical protein CFAM422_012320 [Trichoderma lentiforme]|uniref:Uncharacterized protein n=1 Tax=Trichoderma lentiforme TaxID=1567552 RepID=A0A9P5C6F8_9HYPO|nr:hypothetical protein CFAM422_012320 [Trichoderma lentiforme]
MSFEVAVSTSRLEPIKETYDHLGRMQWLDMRGQKWSFLKDEMENVQVVVEMCNSGASEDCSLCSLNRRALTHGKGGNIEGPVHEPIDLIYPRYDNYAVIMFEMV